MNRRAFLQSIGLTAMGIFAVNNLSDAASADASQAPVICCFGDSTTWGATGDKNISGGGGNDIAWPAKLKKKLNGKIGDIYNIGKKGSRLAVTEERNDSFIERLPAALAKPADIYLVLGGVNDFQHDVPLGDKSSLGNAGAGDTHTIIGAVQTIIEKISEANPSAQIIFLTPMKNNFQHPTKHYPNSFEKNGQGKEQEDYADAIKDVCDYYSVPVIDLYAESGISPFLPAQQKLYMPDGLHYSEAGYDRLATRIAAELSHYIP